jgi:general secretion pathway protein H
MSARQGLARARWPRETAPLPSGIGVARRAPAVGSLEPTRAGFTLLETVCVVAIIALLAALALPAIPRGTSRAKLEAFAVAAAAVLKADRNAALRRGSRVATAISARARTLRSGASGQVLRLPDDIGFTVVLAARCAGRETGNSIEFFPSGMSCGGTLVLSRLGTRFEVRVTWLTGGVEIARPTAS